MARQRRYTWRRRYFLHLRGFSGRLVSSLTPILPFLQIPEFSLLYVSTQFVSKENGTRKLEQKNPLKMPALILNFLLLYFHHFITISSSTIIPLGSSLLASNRNQSWSSPNSTFSLSFIPKGRNSFIAAITHSSGVRIWSIGSGSVVDLGGALHLLPTGLLRLTNGSGTSIWDSATANLGVTSATLDDSGNLSLLNDSTFPIWSSFENPTDTIVPTQNFTSGKKLRSGSYSFSLLRSGNLRLIWKNSIVYWNQGFNSSIAANLTSPRLVLQSNGILMSHDSSFPNGVITAYSTDYGEGAGAGAVQLGQPRGDEVRRVIEIMLRTRKRNPVLVAEDEPELLVKEILRKIESKEIEDMMLRVNGVNKFYGRSGRSADGAVCACPIP